MKKLHSYVNNILIRNRYLSKCASEKNLQGKLSVQFFTAALFFIMSMANIYTKSYPMLIATLFGSVSYTVLFIITVKTKNVTFCNRSSCTVCAIIFVAFVIVGGNDGFACLWIALLPTFTMVIMDFSFGLIVSVVLQIFLFVVFWTPLNQLLLYHYNAQFCLRFPLFFSASLLLSLVTTVSLQKSQYNEILLSRYDPLTGLANRRYAYEVFAREFSDANAPHSIVMGDIDKFKRINDTYDHGFGDEVLKTVAEHIKELLPESYIKARWGGEEFLIAANEPLERVYEKIEVLRKELSEHDFFYQGDHIRISMTFGIAEYAKSDDLKNAIITADNRMYSGKQAGRNRTVTQ